MGSTVSNEKRAIVTKGTPHIAVQTAPDVCKRPGKKPPVAAKNNVPSSRLKKGQTTTSFIAGQPVWTSAGELGPPSDPAHAGTAGGVHSGTYRAEAKPTSFSATVFFEGNAAVRVDDTTTQNHGNTTGVVMPDSLFADLSALGDQDEDCMQGAAKTGAPFVGS